MNDITHDKLIQDYARKSTTLPRNWKSIRRRILDKDKNRCCVCGKKKESYRITVHHRDGNQQNNSTSNLVSLCKECHDKLPVPPFSEAFYCKTVINFHTNPNDEWNRIEDSICVRFGREDGNRNSNNCEFFSIRHGCLLEAFNTRNVQSIESEYF